MALLLRISAGTVCALMTILLLKRTNPELSSLLSLALVVLILFSSLGIGVGFQELRKCLSEQFGLDESYYLPVMKCCAAAVITRLTADQCRDSMQTAAASAVELAGLFCSLGILMPLLITTLKMLGGLL